jgi:hypothetical protein
MSRARPRFTFTTEIWNEKSSDAVTGAGFIAFHPFTA